MPNRFTDSPLATQGHNLAEPSGSSAGGELPMVHAQAFFSSDRGKMTVSDIHSHEHNFPVDGEGAGLPCYSIDLRSRRVWWSPAMRRLYGLNQHQRAPRLRGWLDCVHADDRGAMNMASLHAMVSSGNLSHYFRISRPGARDVWVHNRAAVEYDAQGSPRSLQGVHLTLDVSKMSGSTASLDAIFQRTCEAAAIGMARITGTGQIVWTNQYFCTLFGAATASAPMETIFDRLGEGDRRRLAGKLVELQTPNQQARLGDFEFLRADMSMFWASLSASLVPGSGILEDRILLIVKDVEDRIRRDDHLKAIIGESEHRIRNLMTIMNAAVQHSARRSQSVATMTSQLQAQLKYLAESYELLVGHSIEPTPLSDIVERQIAGLIGPNDSRADITGPPVMMNQNAARALGIVCYELATNATKYGAFSSETGGLEASWEIDHNRDLLIFEWNETLCVDVVQSNEIGHGGSLLRKMVVDTLHGVISHKILPRGLQFRAEIPFSRWTKA